MAGLVAVALITITLGTPHDDSRPGTVTGGVLNSAYFFVRKTNRPLNAGKYALECARGGPPLAILAEDCTVYWPIFDAMPATGQNARLTDSGAQKVTTARGKLFERGSSHALAMETVAEVAEARQPHLIVPSANSYSEGILPMGIGARNSQSAVALVL